jgi:hypothetical protein
MAKSQRIWRHIGEYRGVQGRFSHCPSYHLNGTYTRRTNQNHDAGRQSVLHQANQARRSIKLSKSYLMTGDSTENRAALTGPNSD